MLSGPEGVVLTGVGRSSRPFPGVYVAPQDPCARWDDPGHTRSQDHVFGTTTSGRQHALRGFMFHEACWVLLDRAFHPALVPLKRVFDICDSFPRTTAPRVID